MNTTMDEPERPEEVVRQLEETPESWNELIKTFACGSLGLKPGLGLDGEPVLVRRDGYKARIGCAKGQFLFHATDHRKSSFVQGDGLRCDASAVIGHLVKFANESRV